MQFLFLFFCRKIRRNWFCHLCLYPIWYDDIIKRLYPNLMRQASLPWWRNRGRPPPWWCSHHALGTLSRIHPLREIHHDSYLHHWMLQQKWWQDDGYCHCCTLYEILFLPLVNSLLDHQRMSGPLIDYPNQQVYVKIISLPERHFAFSLKLFSTEYSTEYDGSDCDCDTGVGPVS